MNENINLCEVLKDCPKGTIFWSKVHGEVKFQSIKNSIYPISVIYDNNSGCPCDVGFTKEGFINVYFKGECLLVPSKDQQDWSKWKCPKPKFDPKTLQPFDKVLVKMSDDGYTTWFADFVSRVGTAYDRVPCVISNENSDMVIPYNDETKHLVGTTDEAPEYYRYWEE